MSQRKIITLALIGLILILIATTHFYFRQSLTPIQKNMFGAVIKIPDNDGYEAKLTNIKGGRLEGQIKNIQIGKKTGDRLLVYTDKAMNINKDASSFMVPFEVDYKNNKKYLYLGLFYLDPISPPTIKDGELTNVGDLEMTLKQSSLPFPLGENMVFEKINSIISGSYSSIVNFDYFNGAGAKKNLTIQSYHEKGDAFEIAKKCAEIGSVINREYNSKNYDACSFDNNHECTLEAYENGNCPIGGYDISVTDNQIEKWGIAQGFLFKDGKFIFRADQENCKIEDFYLGRCKVD